MDQQSQCLFHLRQIHSPQQPLFQIAVYNQFPPSQKAGQSASGQLCLAASQPRPHRQDPTGLSFAALVGAWLYGIKNKLKLDKPYSGNIYEKKVNEVPKTLNEAIQLAKKSKFLKEIFPQDVLDHYIHAAEWEQKDYDGSVNDWQLRRYFERG